jgi:hypothetical protein
MTAVAALTSLVVWIGLAKVARIQIMNGSLQRVFASTVFLWIGVISARLFELSRRSAAGDAGRLPKVRDT